MTSIGSIDPTFHFYCGITLCKNKKFNFCSITWNLIENKIIKMFIMFNINNDDSLLTIKIYLFVICNFLLFV